MKSRLKWMAASVSLVISTNRHNQTVTQECMSDRIDPSYEAGKIFVVSVDGLFMKTLQLGIRGFTTRKSF
jgi:hypothetical protein